MCERPQDCFANEACLGGRCVQQSVTLPDASVNRDTSSDVCLECELPDCVNNDDCGANQFCEKENGNGTCVCDPGFHACGDTCFTDDDPEFCGETCARCPLSAFGTAVCVQGECETDCAPGFVLCADCDEICVECNTVSDCGPDAPNCVNNECVGCAENQECDRFPQTLICDDGECVQCTEAQGAACAGNSCDPSTNLCTTTGLRSLVTCDACVSDTECEQGHRCVKMAFAGTDLPGGFCLELENGNGCSRPHPILTQKVSLSSPVSDSYCGIREDFITCTAVNDYGKTCRRDRNEDCGIENLADGQCRRMGGFDKCTYDCVDDDDCPGGAICVNGLYCLEI